MKILFVLAWRNLWRNKRRTLIAVSSVLFAVVLASALLSFAEGFQQQLVETIVRQETGYIQIQDALYHEEPSLDHVFEYGAEVRDALEAYEVEILYTVPRLRGFSLAARDMVTRPAMVTGIVPEKEDRLRDLSREEQDDDMLRVENRNILDLSS
jgi:ABC-type lipoprotein release transport system permease subunit